MIENAPRGGRIGVVIPLFNKENSVEACIRSVLGQSLPAAQIVIVDDQSTDRSSEVAQRLIAGVSVAQVVRQPTNGGPGKARNAGARLLDTEWVAFLDADDRWHPDFLKHMAVAVEATGSDFAGSGRTQIDARRGNEDFLLGDHSPDHPIVLDGSFWTAFANFFPLNSSCNLIALSLFRSVGGFPENMRQREDHALWTRLWTRGRFCFVNIPLVTIEKSAGGLSGNKPRFRDLVQMQHTLNASLARTFVTRRKGTSALARYTLVTALKFGRHIASRGVRALIGPKR